MSRRGVVVTAAIWPISGYGGAEPIEGDDDREDRAESSVASPDLAFAQLVVVGGFWLVMRSIKPTRSRCAWKRTRPIATRSWRPMRLGRFLSCRSNHLC